MSHNISFNNGKAEFAFVGSRDAIWHGLGSELTPGSPIEVWRVEAGMNWKVKESKPEFTYLDDDGKSFTGFFENKKALYRSDTHHPLSIVGNDFKVVQPEEILEFFRDLTEEHGMVLSTAGCLFGGRRFWALAETGNKCEIFKGDEIKGNLLFVTAVDGSLSNTAKFVSTRVVCNNTLTVALNEKGKGKNIVRKSHRSEWDAKQVKIDMGLLNSNWENFVSKLRALSERKMNEEEVHSFFKKTFFDPNETIEDQPIGNKKCVNNLMSLYANGAGVEYDHGTAMGALNAVTNLFTHGNGRRRIPERLFWSGYFNNDIIKNEALNSLLELC